MMTKFGLKSGKVVKVIAGKYRGVIDVIKKVDKKKSSVYLEKINRLKSVKNSKSKSDENKSKIVFIPIHFSNVVLWEEGK